MKPNEHYIKAKDGELVLTSDQQDSFAAQIDSFKTMADAFSGLVTDMPVTRQSLWPNGMAGGAGSSTSNVTTDNSRVIEINEGDIYVSVPSQSGKLIADEVRNITRDNINQISRWLRRP